MKRNVVACIAMAICGAAPAAADTAAKPERYLGVCEASAGAYIDAGRFAVASDESNVIRIYERGSPAVAASVDLTKFTGYDKSDLEDAAVGDGVVYWTASQSENSSGKDKKRKVVFATRIVESDGVTTLEPSGIVREDLKPRLVELSGSSGDSIDIEGLAATPDGGLLFGFRSLVDGKAAIVKLENAGQVLADAGAPAVFGETAMLDLGQRGVRSLARVGERYLIVAGKPDDDAEVGYAVYWWGGEPTDKAIPWDTQPDFSGLDPEVAMLMPGGASLQILSDDGDRCPAADLEDPPSDDRGFSSLDVPF